MTDSVRAATSAAKLAQELIVEKDLLLEERAAHFADVAKLTLDIQQLCTENARLKAENANLKVDIDDIHAYASRPDFSY